MAYHPETFCVIKTKNHCVQEIHEHSYHETLLALRYVKYSSQTYHGGVHVAVEHPCLAAQPNACWMCSLQKPYHTKGHAWKDTSYSAPCPSPPLIVTHPLEPLPSWISLAVILRRLIALLGGTAKLGSPLRICSKEGLCKTHWAVPDPDPDPGVGLVCKTPLGVLSLSAAKHACAWSVKEVQAIVGCLNSIMLQW